MYEQYTVDRKKCQNKLVSWKAGLSPLPALTPDKFKLMTNKEHYLLKSDWSSELIYLESRF